MKKITKVLLLLLALCMITALVSVAAFADNDPSLPRASVAKYNIHDLGEEEQGLLKNIEGGFIRATEKSGGEISLFIYGADPAISTAAKDVFVFTAEDKDDSTITEYYGNDWLCDFVVSFDHDVKADSVILTGHYGNMTYSILLGRDFVANETRQFLISSVGFEFNYNDILNIVDTFICTAINIDEANIGTKANVSLVMWPKDGNKETDTEVIATIPYEFTYANLSHVSVGGTQYRHFASGTHDNAFVINADNSFSLQPPEGPHFAPATVARIDETEYMTLAEAIAAAQDGQTIKLLTDIELSGTEIVQINKSGTYTIDGNGRSITPATDSDYSYHRFLFGDSGQAYTAAKTFIVKNLTISGFSNSTYFIRAEGCNVEFNNCTIKDNDLSGTADSRVFLASHADVTFDGCTFRNNTSSNSTVDFNSNANKTGNNDLIVKDCLFKGNTANGVAIIQIAEDESVSVNDSTFEGNTINASNNGAVVYFGAVGGDCTGSLFKNNTVNYTTTSGYDDRVRVAGAIFTWANGTNPGTIEGNAFVGNQVVKQNASFLTCYAKSVYSGGKYNPQDLAGNYWDGHEPVIAQASPTSSGNDIYAEYDTYAVTASTYAIDYETNENGRGCTVTLYVPPVAQIGETTYGSLAEAIAAAQDGDTIELLADDDVSLTSGGEITINKTLTINGNGVTVYGTPDVTGTNDIFITGSGTVTINDLTVEGFGYEHSTDPSHAPIYVSTNFTGTVNLVDVSISRFNRGGLFLYGGTFSVEDCYIDCANSRTGAFTKGIEIKGNATGTIKDTFICNMERSGNDSTCGIEVYGNGSITVDGCMIVSDVDEHESAKATYGIVSSRVGDHDPSGGNLLVKDTTTNTTNGALSVADSDEYGPVNNYTIVVEDCDFDNYISTWSATSKVTINSGSYSADVYAYAGTVEIKGGIFTDFAPDIYTGNIVITGGVFDADPSDYVKAGYVTYANTASATAANYPYTVGTAVAKITKNDVTTYYATLQAAINAAESGDTVTMLSDITTSDIVFIGKSITLDGDEHSLITSASRGIRVNNSGVTVTIKNLTIPANNNVERAIQVDSDMDNVTLTIDNVTATATSYTVNICGSVDNLNLTITDSTITGWGAVNLWGNNGTVRIEDSILNGVNDKGYNADGWNNFGVLIVEGDTTGATTEHASAYNITVVDTTIEASSTTGNHQYAILYNNPSVANAITLENCTITLGENCSFFLDQGEDCVTKVKNTYLFETTTRPTLPDGYIYAPCGEDYYLITRAVAQIGTTQYATLKDAFDAALNGQTIKLIRNITDDTLGGKGIVINGNKTITLDLNGHDITCTDGSAASNRMIKITGTTTLNVINSSNTLSTMDVLGGNDAVPNTSTATTLPYGVFRAEVGTTLNITGTNKNIKLVNGRAWGLNIKVLGATATIENVIIDSRYGGGIEVTEADLGGHTQIGTTTLTNCEFTQTGYYDHCSTAVSVSGGSQLTVNSGTYTSGNYAIYVFSSGGYVTVNGGTFTGTGTGYAFRAEIDTNSYADYVGGLKFNGGYFSGNFYVKAPATAIIKGGHYTADPTDYLAEGYAKTESTVTGYNWTVTEQDVAKIGDTLYATLKAAIDAANAIEGTDPVTITILRDFTTDAAKTTANDRTVITRPVTIDFGEYTMTVPGSLEPTSNWAALYVDADTVIDATTGGIYCADNGDDCGVYAFTVRNNAKLTVNGGSYYGGGTVLQVQVGSAEVKGGTFAAKTFGDPYGLSFVLNCIDANYAAGTASISVTGGTFVGYDPSASSSEYPHANFVADGYSVVTNNQANTWTVIHDDNYQEIAAEVTETTEKVVQNEQAGTTTTTTTTTTTNLTSDTTSETPTYVIKIETTTTTTTTTTGTDAPIEDPTEVTNTEYKEVGLDVDTNGTATGAQSDTSAVDVTSGTQQENAAKQEAVAAAQTTVEQTVTTGSNTQAATFEAALETSGASTTENVLKTTAAANAIAKAAAKVNSAQTSAITTAKIILQTSLKSYTLADNTDTTTSEATPVKATKVKYDITPVAVILDENNNKLGEAELENSDIESGQTFTFTIPVPANMTAEKIKVSHKSSSSEISEIGTYTPSAADENGIRYITVTVDHFSEFELEEDDVNIDGNCKVTAAIALNDSIDIYFYVAITADAAENKNNYEVVYTFNGGTEVVVSGADWVFDSTYELDDITYRKYRFKVASCAAKQMNDEVDFTVYYGSKANNGIAIKTVTDYSIRKYCVNKINANTDANLVALCRATLSYGAVAQQYFGYKKSTLADRDGYGLSNPVTTVPAFTASSSKATDVTKMSASLSAESYTEVNIYVTTTSDVSNLSVKIGDVNVDGSNISLTTLTDGRKLIKIKGIAAKNLSNVYTITFDTSAGTTTLNYCPLSYATQLQTSSSVGDVCRAIYNYYLKASQYFSN